METGAAFILEEFPAVIVPPLISCTHAARAEAGFPSPSFSMVRQINPQGTSWCATPSVKQGVLPPKSRDPGPYWWGMGHFFSSVLESFKSVHGLGQSFPSQGAGKKDKNDLHITSQDCLFSFH